MNRHALSYLTALLTALLAASCISDSLEPCPALYVTLGVKDKNFTNIDRVPEETRRPDNLPFAAYVPTLYYVLRDVKTGEIVEEQGAPANSTEPLTRLDLCPCIPHGRYVLNVYGALGETEKPEPDGTIHLDHSSDTYLASDTLLYDAWHNGQCLDMERAKDELIIEIEGLPHGHYTVETRVTALDEEVDPAVRDLATRFRYTGRTEDKRAFQFEGEPMKLLLPPTVSGAALSVKITGTADSEGGSQMTISLNPRDVSLNLERNMITVVRYVYKPDAPDHFLIYVLVNGSWEQISSLDLE